MILVVIGCSSNGIGHINKAAQQSAQLVVGWCQLPGPTYLLSVHGMRNDYWPVCGDVL